MPFLPGLFRNGRDTSPQSPSGTNNKTTPKSQTPPTTTGPQRKGSPSAFKAYNLAARISAETTRSQSPTIGMPRNHAEVKVRDLGSSSALRYQLDSDDDDVAESSSRSLPPTPLTSAPPRRPSVICITAQEPQVTCEVAHARDFSWVRTPGSATHSAFIFTNTSSTFTTNGSAITRQEPNRPRAYTVDVLASEPPSPKTILPSTPARKDGSDSHAALPNPRRRPTPLNLRRSNLSPPLSPSPLPRRSRPVPSPITKVPSPIPADLPKPEGPPTPYVGVRRCGSAELKIGADVSGRRSRQRSNSADYAGESVKLPNTHHLGQHTYPQTAAPKLPSREFASTDSSTLASYTFPTSYDNVPLPWSSEPASSQLALLGESNFLKLVSATISTLDSASPRILPPCVLQSASSEDIRLRAELDQLRDKYHHLILQRDHLHRQVECTLVKQDATPVVMMVAALSKITKKCDRIARQVYICNDQIRQIQVQRQGHIVGCLRIALERSHPPGLSSESPVQPSWSSPRATSDKSSPASSLRTDPTTPNPDPNGNGNGNEASSIDTFDEEDLEDCESTIVMLTPLSAERHSILVDSKRTSTATIISIDDLTFPLPPSRRGLAFIPGKRGPEAGLEVEVEEESSGIESSNIEVTQKLGTITTAPSRRNRCWSSPFFGPPAWTRKGYKQGGVEDFAVRRRYSTDGTRRVRFEQTQLTTPEPALLNRAVIRLSTPIHIVDGASISTSIAI